MPVKLKHLYRQLTPSLEMLRPKHHGDNQCKILKSKPKRVWGVDRVGTSTTLQMGDMEERKNENRNANEHTCH